MIGSGHEKDGLSFLDVDRNSPVTSSALSATISPLQWHFRLGHPSMAKLQLAIPTLSRVSSLECEACQLGKHHRSSFPSSSHGRQKESFDLVHTDIWGPSRTLSITGYHYFVVFVDDYSRMTWLFLLKQRSELPYVLFPFSNSIFTRKRIQIIRSDNAMEYIQSAVDSFCIERGIIHQTSCTRSSQQNGIAERKLRHLLDVARTLLFHMRVPKHFWSDAVLTACYLINRMPSVILNQGSPFTLLYPESSPFSLTPSVFGCVAFVHVLDPGRDKLYPRARKCIFLGYSRTQKGYRCYHPESWRYFVSSDVTFFESTSYFTSTGHDLSSDLICCSEGESSHFSPTLPVFYAFPAPPPLRVPLPLQVYTRSKNRRIFSCGPDTSSSPSEVPASLSARASDDLPIALRRGKRACTQHPIANAKATRAATPKLLHRLPQ